MAKKRDSNTKVNMKEGEISLGTKAWNQADVYTKLKIMRHLSRLDKYEMVAQFGTDDMDKLDDENPISEEERKTRRIEGLQRLQAITRMLIGNVKFAIKRKKDKEKLDGFLERVNTVRDYIDGAWEYKEDNVTHENQLIIRENHFRLCLRILQEIKDELNIPINNAGLIFQITQETNLDKLQKRIEEGGL
ncbi:MAG: hypothetical protein ACOC1X_01290 [Promethearchaeota archaeon]